MVFSSAIVSFDRDHVCSTRIPTSVIGVIAGLSFGPFSGTLINVLGIVWEIWLQSF